MIIHPRDARLTCVSHLSYLQSRGEIYLFEALPLKQKFIPNWAEALKEITG